MTHTTVWVEKEVRSGTVKFTCTRCGRTMSGSKKEYENCTWVLPAEH